MTSTNTFIRDYRKEIPGSLSDDRLTWSFPMVESVNTNGKKMFWKIYVRCIDSTIKESDQFIPINDAFFDSKPMAANLKGWINVDSGLVGMKVRKTIPTVIHKGLNSDKTNATNVFTQALRDAYGQYNKHAKKAFSGTTVATEAKTDKPVESTQTTEFLPPMLAQILKDQKVKPKISPEHPLYVQRKYNGVRTVTTLQVDTKDDITTYTVVMYSRRKNLYPGFEYIKAELLPVLKEYWLTGQKLYLDGEIYKHGAALQDISGQARRDDKEKEESTEKYDYMIYDCFDANKPELIYSERKDILDAVFGSHNLTYAKYVETFECTTYEEIDAHYNDFLKEGFEGAMVRLDAKYNWSYNERHSKVLLKMKPTYDAEFEVVGMSAEGKGKAAGCLMIICKTTMGKQFPVTPAMELIDRKALAEKMKVVEPNGKTHFDNHWLGKPLIVYYDELSKDKLPQRARTKLEIRTWA